MVSGGGGGGGGSKGGGGGIRIGRSGSAMSVPIPFTDLLQVAVAVVVVTAVVVVVAAVVVMGPAVAATVVVLIIPLTLFGLSQIKKVKKIHNSETIGPRAL